MVDIGKNQDLEKARRLLVVKGLFALNFIFCSLKFGIFFLILFRRALINENVLKTPLKVRMDIRIVVFVISFGEAIPV